MEALSQSGEYQFDFVVAKSLANYHESCQGFIDIDLGLTDLDMRTIPTYGLRKVTKVSNLLWDQEFADHLLCAYDSGWDSNKDPPVQTFQDVPEVCLGLLFCRP